MAVLTEEPTRVSSTLDTRTSLVGTTGRPRREEGRHWWPLAWLAGAGEFVLGLVLTLFGLLARAVLAVRFLAAPLVALVLLVLLFGLMIDGAGLVLRAADLMR